MTDQTITRRDIPGAAAPVGTGVPGKGDGIALGGVRPAGAFGAYDQNVKYLTGAYYGTGYHLNPSYTALNISSATDVSQNGVFVTTVGAVYNYGTIAMGDTGGDDGISLEKGGYVLNAKGASIDSNGYASIATSAGDAHPSTVINNGVITTAYDGVVLLSGGYVGVGVGAAINAVHIDIAITGAAGVVHNLGTLNDGGDTGVVIAGGTVLNGDADTPAGVIAALTGVYAVGATTVVNYGRISGANDAIGGSGVILKAGGSVANGTAADTSALIWDTYGVSISAGVVNNFGTINAVSSNSSGFGAYLGVGSSLTNGSLNDRRALIEGNTGVIAGATSTVGNFGTILGETSLGLAVYLKGGSLTNGTGADTTALIQGYRAIVVSAAGTVTNFGTVDGTKSEADSYAIGDYAALFTDGGKLTNGSQASPSALIEGYGGVQIQGATGSVINAGTIEALGRGGQYGVDLAGGGQVDNGGFSDAKALIEGVNGVGFGKNAHYGSVLNYGTIQATYAAVTMNAAGGKVVNGGPTQQGALIEGGAGVLDATAVINYGAIRATRPNIGAVDSSSAVAVTNGGGGDTTALIIGDIGVEARGGRGSVVNFGTIVGLGGAGLYLKAGGVVTNGAGTDRTALIEGYSGIDATNVTVTVRNFGSIVATGGAYAAGVLLSAGGVLTNGSATDAVALIEGYSGAVLGVSSAVTNFGTILGEDATGVALGSASSLVNGAAGHAGAIIEGLIGVSTAGYSSATTVTNFGTIIGQGGTAVYFGSASDVLVVEAGSAFVGAVDGYGGTLELGSGTGTLTGLLTGGDVTVSGSMATTTFTNFGTVEVASGASFTVAGGGKIAAGQGLIDAGTLTTTGTLAIAGALTTSGTLTGTGTLAITGGTSTFNAGTSLTIAKVTVAGATTVVNVTSTGLAYAGAWAQSAGKLTVAAGGKIVFTGTADSFAGTVSGAGAVVFNGGADTFSGLTLSATSQSIAGAAVTLSGLIALGANLDATTPNLTVAAGGATLGGAGVLVLSNTATNSLHGASASATLTDNGKIEGAGLIGGGVMKLVIGSGGFVDGDDALALTINTGTNTIANAGIIYAVGAGGTIVDSAVANTGKLYADGGVLTLDGAVTGAGAGYINGGTLDAASTFTENVSFLGTTGVLELAHSQTYTGDITGFSKTGTTSLDLGDITFTAGTTKATYTGTTTSGVLTVTDGTHVAKITLEGNYTTSTFTTSSDGHGGTKVVDPTAPTQGHAVNPTPLHAFIDAMASLGARASEAVTASNQNGCLTQPLLAAPGP